VEVFFEKILIVDNEIPIRQLLQARLSNLGYKVFLTSNGKDAIISFIKEQPDIIILDLILPKLDGYAVCRKIREQSDIPIIILTTLDNISDQVLELGLEVNDYVTKPFSPKELEFRIRSVLYNYNLQVNKSLTRKKIFQINELIVDMDKKVVSKTNRIIKLTETEFNLLELLIENAGNTLSRLTILENIWGYTPERYTDTRLIDVYISKLRLKIEENSRNPDLILTVRGVGYMFQSIIPKD
jgi:OmpR family response regulator RpaB